MRLTTSDGESSRQSGGKVRGKAKGNPNTRITSPSCSQHPPTNTPIFPQSPQSISNNAVTASIAMSDRRSPSRGRSPTPDDARSRSHARSVTPRDDSPSRSRSRSRGPAHANGTRDSRSRSRSRSNSRPRSVRPASPDRQPRSAKIVIEKLTKNVNESHLREIFGSYGDIEDLEMPINRQFLTNRGIAYVLYATPADAESAIAHMHEAQLDGATINVSIVLPRRRFSRSPAPRRPPPNRFGEPHRYREPPPSRPGPERAYGGRGGPRGGGGGGRGGGGGFRDEDRSYRPRSYSPGRSPPPRRRRSPSYDSRSPSRSPPPRRRESPPRGGGGGRRRSPSYSNASDRSDSRDRSRSRDRGGRRR